MDNWAKIIIGDSRKMNDIENNSIHLVVTSPPYWTIKNYGINSQIGYGQTLHEYLTDLYIVWKECYRILKPGRRLVINIGDQFARKIIYGRYKIIPLHSEVISQCEKIGFDYMGDIIWQKKTTMNTTGGANVMGSYPFPPNGMIEIDYEHILIFKKPGNNKEKIKKEVKEKSQLTKSEWKEFFSGHWYFAGAKQSEHEAMFPEELPRRIIKMFSFIGETVVDPFLGSGTTMKVAIDLKRNSIGYEINEKFLKTIKDKIGMNKLIKNYKNIEIIRNTGNKISLSERLDYIPSIKDAKPIIEPERIKFSRNKNYYKVIDILKNGDLKLDTGIIIKFLGVIIKKLDKTISYLNTHVLKKKVYLKFDKNSNISIDDNSNNSIEAYVYLKNKIFINGFLIKSGFAIADKNKNHILKDKFIEFENQQIKNVV